MAEYADEPQADLLPAPCQEAGCTNDIEGRCSGCGTLICGSCFNNGHEWGSH